MRKFVVLLAGICMGLGFAWEVQAGSYQNLPDPVEDHDYFNEGVFDPGQVQLGRLLFFDKILSGNQNISCATCHHPFAGTSDGLSLPIGEGAQGVSVTRNTGTGPDAVHERVPRNSPTIFNSGALEFNKMFHDGRVSINPGAPSGFDSPAGGNLPSGLDNVLSVQAMFPVTSGTEMAGQAGENTIANEAAINHLAGAGGVWDLLAQRLQAIPEYVDLFKAAYSDVNVAGDITYVHAANAIAAFEAHQWRADNSPFDRFLWGDRDALSPEAKRGARLFYGHAGCSHCHSGPFQTDQQFHAIAMPQIGAGKGDNQPGYADGRDDFGRERVTGNADDRFKFRTPSLRNVELTAPYGHSGAFATLEEVVLHHLNAVESLYHYNQTQAVLPSRPDLDALDFQVMNDPDRLDSIAQHSELPVVELNEGNLVDLLAFLRSLTDPASVDLRIDVPARVPSGLPVFD
ncbi:MAG: cytochrome-c peroxidase [Nitrospinota bacterium]|nr:cytochrome-c peroxidase [Nitrospinota bacterium]